MNAPIANPVTLGQACQSVLLTADPHAKVMAARAAARHWRLGRLGHRFDVPMPDAPARPEHPQLLAPGMMPKRRKGGTEANRIALLHALAHIEFVAIDLAFDLVGRFGGQFPAAFADDWMKVGADEAMHFVLLDRRLRQLGSFYGAHPAHDGLWESAHETRHDALARLAVVPMVLEARGLDVTPATITRFESAGDSVSAIILNRIYNDEISHVFAGTKWFEAGCSERRILPKDYWKLLVNRHFRGSVKPPFNDSARLSAGLSRDYYA
ncbi:MAG: ferritin-like domain-containing protein [Sphingorhabdus sp.]|uniref:ferritin-like domain-containing protein n=1 Tax=Sphingorhabdus sp. TaxID=1902408 RepID=UPI0038FD2A9F